jgi:PAS domain S-box-containing protein
MEEKAAKKNNEDLEEYHKNIGFLSSTIEDLTEFALDADIYTYIAKSLKKITPLETIIFVSSLDPDTKTITVRAAESSRSRLHDIEETLGHSLLGTSFPVPETEMASLLTGECEELFGGVSTLSFGQFPEEACRKIECMPFFGRVFGAGISWKGTLYGITAFVLPPGCELKNPRIISMFIRQVAGYLQRRQAEKALRESQEKYHEIFELGREAIFLIDNATGNLIEANTSATEMYGYSRDELVTMRNTDLSAEPEETRRVTTGTPTGSVVVPLRYHRKKDGTVFPVEITGRFFTWKGRSVHVAAIRDITERKRAEEMLRQEHAQLNRITETSPVGIVFVDRDGKITFANHRAEKILGITKDRIMQRTYNSPDWRITAEDGKPFPDDELPFRRVKADGHPVFNVRHAIEWPDGHRVLLSVNAAPIADTEGRFDGMVATVEDISERRMAEEALRLANNKLNLLSSITRHDILNSLTTLLGYLELSKMHSTDSVLLEYIGKEEKAAETIRRQISFTKDYQDIGIRSPQWQDAEKTIVRVISTLHPERVTLSVDVKNIEIFADPLLEKVFYNLVENALRHGKKLTRVGFSSKESEDGLTLICEDDGNGIPGSVPNML